MSRRLYAGLCLVLAVPALGLAVLASVVRVLSAASDRNFGFAARYSPGGELPRVSGARVWSRTAWVYADRPLPTSAALAAAADISQLLLVAVGAAAVLVVLRRAANGQAFQQTLAWSLLAVGAAAAIVALLAPYLAWQSASSAIDALGLQRFYRGRGAPPHLTGPFFDPPEFAPNWALAAVGLGLLLAAGAVASLRGRAPGADPRVGSQP